MSFENEVRKKAKSIFEKVKADSKIPALSYGITYQGQLIASEDLGFIDQSNQIPADKNSVYPIASMTKSFAGAATLVLRDRGLLRLSDLVVKYIPELKRDSRWEKITVYDLTIMNTGLQEDNPWGDRQIGLSDTEFSEIYKRGGSGEFVYCDIKENSFSYSNLSYMMLGRVFSVAAKQHALSFILENLVQPLGMDSTCWTTNHLESRRYAKGYNQENAEIRAISSIGDGAVFGGLFSSVRDILVWTDFLIESKNSKYDKILSRTSRLELRSRGKVIEDQNSKRYPVNYSFGIIANYLVKHRCVAFGHTGGLPGFGSRMTFVPESQLSIVALSNLTYAPVPDVCDRLADDLLEILPRQRLRSPPLIETRYQQIISLIENWSESETKETFATNFFLDFDIGVVKAKFSKIKERLGDKKLSLNPEKYLGANIEIDQIPVLNFSLAPAEFGKIQSIIFID